MSGCCIYGVLSPGGLFTGDDIAWVYPDSRTALLGERESQRERERERCHNFLATVFPPDPSHIGMLTLFSVNNRKHKIYEEIFVGTFQDGRMIEVTVTYLISTNSRVKSVGQPCCGGSEDSLR